MNTFGKPQQVTFFDAEDTPLFQQQPKVFRINDNPPATLDEVVDLNPDLPSEVVDDMVSLALGESVSVTLGAHGSFTIRRIN